VSRKRQVRDEGSVSKSVGRTTKRRRKTGVIVQVIEYGGGVGGGGHGQGD